MSDPVLQTVELGFLWPTVDPFLFCAHHLDRYPEGDDRMAPRASLEGRELGMDFEGRDGWRMYHGHVVPGFPQHPHRGFETVTLARQGFIDHSDSLGAKARFGRGDLQWLTAGAGIVHCEMFPLLDDSGPNTCELFQIWLNLPAVDKMVDPYFTMYWNEDIPRHVLVDGDGRSTTITVLAGSIGGVTPPKPPPDSYASKADADVAIWHLVADPDAVATLPPAGSSETVRTVYVFEGSLRVAGRDLPTSTGAVLLAGEPVEVVAGRGGAEVLILQGRPIGEPVAKYGPFVMSTAREIEQAYEDYRRTGFGGWPWPSDDPVHPRDAGRFAVHADGRVERPEPEPAVG